MTRKDRQQGVSLRPADGIWRTGFRKANHPHPCEILMDDEGSPGGNQEGSSAERNTPTETLSGSARIANQNPLRGSG